jgi:hypothetical protein
MDEKNKMRQYWVRVLLFAGMLWGTMPLLMLVFVLLSANATPFEAFATAFSSLTVLPASVLGFWHRRRACVWLTANAVILLFALAALARHTQAYSVNETIGFVGSILIAVGLDFMELRRWPAALAK